MLARLHERDGDALATGPSGPPDPMDVRVGVGRHVEVDDVRDVLDVEPARGDVRRDEDVERAVPEAAHDPVAGLLGQPAVEGSGVVAPGAQRLGQVVHLAAGPGEDEGRAGVLDVEDPAQRGELVGAADDVGDLADERDAVRGRPLGVDRDPGRVAQVALGDAGDGRRDGRREERGLAILGRGGQDRLEVLREAHVEHLVGLVEDDDPDPVEPQAAALEMVDRPARAWRRRRPRRGAGRAAADRSAGRRRSAGRGRPSRGRT